jgi:hypothetical protein
MKKRIRQNYKNRRFVWLTDVKFDAYYEHEHNFVRNYFSNRSFTYNECKDIIVRVIKLRPNYLTKNGKDHTNIEAGHRFRILLDVGVIKELK